MGHFSVEIMPLPGQFSAQIYTQRLLADARWLPEPLRLADTDTLSEPGESEAEASSVDLPAFLSGDEEAADEDTEPLPAIAAE